MNIRRIEKKDSRKKQQDIADLELEDPENENYIKELKDEIENSESSLNYLEESISMLERTSMKLYPVVNEVIKRMIGENSSGDQPTKEDAKSDGDVEKLLLRDES